MHQGSKPRSSRTDDSSAVAAEAAWTLVRCQTVAWVRCPILGLTDCCRESSRPSWWLSSQGNAGSSECCSSQSLAIFDSVRDSPLPITHLITRSWSKAAISEVGVMRISQELSCRLLQTALKICLSWLSATDAEKGLAIEIPLPADFSKILATYYLGF